MATAEFHVYKPPDKIGFVLDGSTSETLEFEEGSRHMFGCFIEGVAPIPLVRMMIGDRFISQNQTQMSHTKPRCQDYSEHCLLHLVYSVYVSFPFIPTYHKHGKHCICITTLPNDSKFFTAVSRLYILYPPKFVGCSTNTRLENKTKYT